MSLDNLEEVISDSISDALADPQDAPEQTLSTEGDYPATEGSEAPVEGSEGSESTSGAAEALEAANDLQVDTPATRAEQVVKQVEDKFAKEHGLAPQLPSGRENRIPYSRVKAIVTKAEQKVTAPLQAKVTEYEAKLADSEKRWQEVGQFEQVMTTDAPRFLQMLSTLPAYKEFFSAVSQAVQAAQGQQRPAPTQPQDDGMPQPDQKLTDGSMVYSMEGLKALNAWNREQARKETISEVEKRYGPIERAWQTQQQIDQLVPQIQAQIDHARQSYPQFTENENEITQALQRNPRLSLEGAYLQVVTPKLQGNREQMRADLLKEIKSAPPPRSTSVPGGGTRQVQQKAGPQSLEDVISQSIKGLDR